MIADFDIAIAGSGFGGSILAMILRQLGRSVVLIERGQHPRFAIGESSTPLANLLLEQIADQYALPRLRPLAKYGTWQKTYPQLPCGLKRGFSFFHHELGKPWRSRPDRKTEVLVAASPHDAIADTHWYRPDFDAFLVSEAQKLGVEFIDQIQIQSLEFGPQHVHISALRNHATSNFRARYFIDATGPRGFLHKFLSLSANSFPNVPQTQAVYAHFHNVARWEEQPCYSPAEIPPYPVDDAALHHIFPGGWIWILRFNNGITSAGAALDSQQAESLAFTNPAAAWDQLLSGLPSIREQFAYATPVTPFMRIPKLSFRASRAFGDRWVMLPSTLGFVDPLLSMGFPMNLLGIMRLAQIFQQHWDSPDVLQQFGDYEAASFRDLGAAANLVGALYRNFNNFDDFIALSMFYFAAASFTEARLRLHKTSTLGSFLFSDNTALHKQLYDCKVLRAVEHLIAPFNIAGLATPKARNWYPVRVEDLYENAPKLSATPAEIETMLLRSGYMEPAPQLPKKTE